MPSALSGERILLDTDERLLRSWQGSPGALALKAFVFPVTTFSFLLAYVETLENLILTKNLNHFFSQSPKKPYTELVVCL